MRICLVYPPLNTEFIIPNVYPPMGIAYLASYLEQIGHSVSIVDAVAEGWDNKREDICGLGFDETVERIKGEKPDLVGLSCPYSGNSSTTLDLAKQIKEEIDVPSVIGGSHPSILPEESLEAGIDHVIIGEGEERLEKLIEHIEDNGNLADIDGLAYKENGNIKVNEPTTYIKDLDSLPYPARHLLPMERYFEWEKHADPDDIGEVKRSGVIISSRGCPYKCVFCSTYRVWGRVWRSRSAENVLDEIGYLKEKYNINHIRFMDDNMTLNIKRAKKILGGMIEREFDVTWTAPNGLRADIYDDELLDLMKKSGCLGIHLAIESGDQCVSDSIVNKRLNLGKAEDYTKKAIEKGIPVSGLFIIGFPGETPEQMKNTVNFAKKLTKYGLRNSYFNVPMPLLGTRLREIGEERGLLVNNDYSKISRYNVMMRNEYLDEKELQRYKLKAYFETKLTRLLYHPIPFMKDYLKPRKILDYSKVIRKMTS